MRIFEWSAVAGSAIAAAMAPRNPLSGGFFLMLAIMIGFGWGLTSGHAMEGVLIGTGVGIAISVAIWLTDRRGNGR